MSEAARRGLSTVAGMSLPTGVCATTLCRMVPGDERILTHLRRGVVEYCVLAMVADEPTYGLDIARRLARDGILMTGEGTLYPLLSRLRTAGFVETRWEESTEGPPRRYYAITASGRGTLDAFRRTWAPFRDAVDAAVDPQTGSRP